MGAHAAGKLRVAVRDRGGVARDHPRGWCFQTLRPGCECWSIPTDPPPRWPSDRAAAGTPGQRARQGYVPNVVYSCGSMIHAGHVVLPYGFADVGASVATIALEDLFTRLTT